MLKPCTVEGCEKHTHGKLCSMHRARLKRRGTTDAGPGSHGTLADRYERYVVRNADGCWDWTSGVNERGYAKIGQRFAHRLSWELHHGPIPAGCWVLHHCDNPVCTKPEHLFLGTHADNMADAATKGRLDGSPSRGHKLTAAQAREIRQLRTAEWSRRRVAERFDIHVDNVSAITSGRMWRTA